MLRRIGAVFDNLDVVFQVFNTLNRTGLLHALSGDAGDQKRCALEGLLQLLRLFGHEVGRQGVDLVEADDFRAPGQSYNFV